MDSKMIESPTLHRIEPREHEAVCQMMLRSYHDYPKLMKLFPDETDRMAGIEAVVRYYSAYDFHYGAGFSLDEGLHECVAMLHSSEFDFENAERILAANCENDAWRAAMDRLTPEQRALWQECFEELDRLEAELSFPEEYLYLDFLAVDPAWQHQGRGRRLMGEVIKWAKEHDLPIMLFTNTEYDIRFYRSLGFEVTGVTRSERYGFENTYVVWGG